MQLDTALSPRALESSAAGCYAGMGSAAPDGVQAWRCPTVSCRSSLPMALEVREPPPRPLFPDIILRLCIGAGAGFATVQPLGANIHTLVTQDLTQTREG